MEGMSAAVRPSNLDPAVAARLKRDADGLVAAVAQQYDTGEVLMLGLDGRRGAAPHADHRPGDLLEPQPPGVLAQGRHLRATSSTCARCASTATATRCWSRSTRSARPATPATAPASTRGLLAPDRRSDRGRTGRHWADEHRRRRTRSRHLPRARPRPPGHPGDPATARRRRHAGRASTASSPASGPARSCSSRPSTAGSGRATPSSASAPPRR